MASDSSSFLVCRRAQQTPRRLQTIGHAVAATHGRPLGPERKEGPFWWLGARVRSPWQGIESGS